MQCRIQSIFWDTLYSCYCKLWLVNFPWWGLRGRKFLILITLGHWKRHFRKKNYFENYFYLLKSTKSTKTTTQKCWRNIIWTDFFGHPYCTNGIKTHLGSLLVTQHSEYVRICFNRVLNIPWVLNMPGFWIWQCSEYANVTQSSKYARIWLCIPE